MSRRARAGAVEDLCLIVAIVVRVVHPCARCSFTAVIGRDCTRSAVHQAGLATTYDAPRDEENAKAMPKAHVGRK